MLKDKILLFILIISVFFSCENTNKDNSLLDSYLWKKDSLGCNGYRYSKIDSIVQIDSIIQNWNKSLVIKKFGEPNVKKLFTYKYFMSNGLQCSYVNEDGYDTLEVHCLSIDFNIFNQVEEVNIIVK